MACPRERSHVNRGDVNPGSLDRARSLLAGVLGLDTSQVGDTAGMNTLAAWDSLAHVRLLLRLEKEAGRTLGPDEALSIRDVGGIARLLDQR